MRDLDERHASPLDQLLHETWMILAHEDLLRLNRPVAGKPDRWIDARVVDLRRRHDSEARNVVAARPTITARALADRIRQGPPAPNRDPAFDPHNGLNQVRALKAKLSEDHGG